MPSVLIQAGRDKPIRNNINPSASNPAPVNNPQVQTRAASNQEIAAIAQSLGYFPIKDPNFARHGQTVFSKGQSRITYDIDGHIGGFWKKVNNKGCRLGTYNRDLSKQIGN